jgi:hypothetical protein
MYLTKESDAQRIVVQRSSHPQALRTFFQARPLQLHLRPGSQCRPQEGHRGERKEPLPLRQDYWKQLHETNSGVVS